jgi:hypothetical protein
VQDGWLTDRCIRPHGSGQQIKARFVQKHQGTLLIYGFFLSVGASCSRQR